MKQRRFLIARIDRIGDVVLSTPLPREIKKKYPDSFVVVLVKNKTQDIYLNNPNIDAILTYDNKSGVDKPFGDMVSEIKHFKFSYAFMLLPRERLNYILFFAGIFHRVGVGHKVYQFLTFTRYVDRNKYIPLRHEADYCLDMIRKVGIDVSEIHPEIFLSEEEKNEVNKLRSSVSSNSKKIIGIHTSSGNSAPNLNPNEYKRIIELLLQNKNIVILITDNEPGIEIKNIPNVKYIFKGESLRKDIVRFAALDLLISNSTGPMHICAALKVPTISFFCPLTACSSKLWGPLGNKSDLILPEQIYCNTQCPIDPKKCDYSKPGGLNAEYLVERIKDFIERLD